MKTVLIFTTLFIVTFSAYTQPALKAMYIYNFAAQTEYPEEYRTGDFVIGIVGNSPVVAELQKIAQLKKIGSQSISVKVFSNAGAVTKCHVLFIPEGKSSQIEKLFGVLGAGNTLTVGEKDGMCKDGAAINFVISDQKLKFELSKVNMKKRGLKPTSYLEKLSIIID